ncbi:MAG TPA: signal peptidase I [bacterium]|nr:signal peptidase I [bacterium]
MLSNNPDQDNRDTYFSSIDDLQSSDQESEQQDSNFNYHGQPVPTENSTRSFFLFLFDTLKIVIISLAIVLPLRAYVVQPFYVKGASMEPNFHDHEYLLIDEISYRFNEPQRGDIVVFRFQDAEKSFFIKRIIGLPGEKIVLDSGAVMIYNQTHPNGFKLDESLYLPSDTITSGQLELTLEVDKYFVMGDNRVSSLDSRRFGAITRASIVGRTWLRGWPIDKFKVFKTPIY